MAALTSSRLYPLSRSSRIPVSSSDWLSFCPGDSKFLRRARYFIFNEG